VFAFGGGGHSTQALSALISPVSRAQGQKNAAKNAKQFVAFTSGHLSGVVVPFLLTHLLTFRAVNRLNRELKKNRFLKVVSRGIKRLLFFNHICVRHIFCTFLGGLECFGHFLAYVASTILYFFRDVCIRSQRADDTIAFIITKISFHCGEHTETKNGIFQLNCFDCRLKEVGFSQPTSDTLKKTPSKT